jgi:hypothetical protein
LHSGLANSQIAIWLQDSCPPIFIELFIVVLLVVLEFNIQMNSSKHIATETLAALPVSEIRRFLLRLANLRDDERPEQFLARFVRLWPVPGRFTAPLISDNILRTPGAKPESEQINALLHKHWLLPLRDGVRSIWSASNARTKHWGVFRILDEICFQEDVTSTYGWPFLQHPGKVVVMPAPTNFEQILMYLIRPDVHTHFCENAECPAPYFFAFRRSRKYCSEDCAAPAQREFKRRWWNRKGEAWRKKREKRKGRSKKR